MTTALLAIGQQDVHITGAPEISFWRSSFKRHTNFSQSTERAIIQGRVNNGGTSSVRFDRKGDMLSYVVLVPDNGTQATSVSDWSTVIDKVELLIGGAVIDTQDSIFTQHVASKLLAQNLSKSRLGGYYGSASTFYPLRFFFCESWAQALPLTALSYHDVEIRITWGASADSSNWQCFANYIFLDEAERAHFSEKPIDMIISQTQKNIGSGSTTQELTFNHPVKFLASAKANGASMNLLSATNKLKLQLNGSDQGESRFATPFFTAIPSFFHTTHGDNDDDDALMIVPFCLDTAKAQSTGSLNFSRLDSARLISSSVAFTENIYAVNLNVLSIENGMGALKFAN